MKNATFLATETSRKLSAAKDYLAVHPLEQVVLNLFTSLLFWSFALLTLWGVYSVIVSIH